jgi:hypothetical protein
MSDAWENVCPSITPQVVWRDVEGDLVLFDERSGEYHALNASASFVWRGIARGQMLAAIVAEATAACPARAAEIAADVRAFVASAAKLGLLGL